MNIEIEKQQYMRFNWFKKKRYFIITYAYGKGYGSCTVVSDSMYLIRSKFYEDVIKTGIKDASILNIIEVNKSDYEDFIK